MAPAGKRGPLALPDFVQANSRGSEAGRAAAECKSVVLDHLRFAPILSPYYSMILRLHP